MRSIRAMALLLASVVSCLSLMAAEPAPNLLKNGDFESDAPGEVTIGKMPASWPKPYGSRVLSIVSETRPGSEGKQCLKIGTSEKISTGGTYSELFPIDATKGIHVAGWIRPGKPTKNLRGLYFGVGWFDQAKKPIILREGTTVNYHYINRKEQQGEWFRLWGDFLPAEGTPETYYYRIPAEAAFMDVRVFALNFSAPAWFDDIEVTAMTDEETEKQQKAVEEQSRKAQAVRARSAVKPRPKVDLDAEWLVCWQGEKKASEAADVLSGYLGKVLDKPFGSAEWQPNTAKNVFLVTDVAHAPTDLAARLEGKRGDAFVIEYPVEVDGRKVCLMVSQDEYAYDRPVYYFLTKFLDVNWVGPGDLGEVFEPRPDWKMPESIDVLENSDFEMRHWYSPTFTCRQWLAAGVRMGFHHALGNVFSPDKHRDTPEVYPLVNGKRYIPEKKDGHYLGGWQPCTANPKSIEIATNYVLECFEKNPWLATASLSVNDGAGNTCECALCRAQDAPGSHDGPGRPNLSDRFYRFYNAVIERAAEQNPRARLAGLSYGAVNTPPTQVRVDPRIYVFEVCPSVKDLRAWKAAGANPNLYMWLWDGGFLTVRPDLDSVVKVIREAHRLGGIGFYSEVIPHWIVSAPRFYVISHLLWDTGREPKALLDRYFELAYGKAAAHVEAYFEQWAEIYRRYPPEEHYHTSMGWRSPQQFEHLRREDLPALASALDHAVESQLSEKQRERLEYLRGYHEILDVNAREYLASQELSNQKWLAESEVKTILTLAERTTSLTPRFDELYKARVLKDKSGWLLDNKYYQDPEKFYQRFVAQLRNTVSSNAATSIDGAIDFIVSKKLKAQPREKVVAFLESEIRKRPALESYLGPRLNKLKGVTYPNLVVNGDFEQGEPGDPPRLPGWDFYRFYGMVKGVTARHDWKAGNGRDGGKAIGMGEGRYPEMKGIVELEKGRRYEVSFWYKSVNRKRNSSFSLFYYDGDLQSPREIEYEKIQMLQSITLEPTEGEWKRFATSFKPERSGKYVMQLAVYYQEKDAWAWFDDVEIRRLW